MTIYALIPARGSSKRIPGKNLIEFHGKEIIRWPLETLKSSALVDRLFVSSDSAEILAVAEKEGAETVLRAPELSDDMTGIAAVVREFIKSQNMRPKDIVVCVLATNVWLKEKRLEEGLRIISQDKDVMVVALGRYGHPISRRIRKERGSFKMHITSNASAVTQGEEDIFFDAGYYYIARAETWLNRREVFSLPVKGIELKRYEFLDIDDYEDLELARRIFNQNE